MKIRLNKCDPEMKSKDDIVNLVANLEMKNSTNFNSNFLNQIHFKIFLLAYIYLF